MYPSTSLLEDISSIFRNFDNLLQATNGEFATPEATHLLIPATGSDLPARPPVRRWGFTYPAVEFIHRDDQIVFRAELPGIDPADVNVQIQEGRLIISGEKKSTHEEDEPAYLQETFRGRFQRAFSLPEGITAEQVKARFENGVLEVTMPAANPKEEARRVPIQVLNAAGKEKTS